MNTQSPGVSSRNVEIALLQKDMFNIQRVCEKLDSTIEKMEELLRSTTQLISLHEQKLEHLEQIDNILTDQLDKRIDDRISYYFTSMKQTILEEVLVKVNTPLKTQSTKNSIKEFFKTLEPWHYMAVGGLVVIAWIMQHLDIPKIWQFFIHDGSSTVSNIAPAVNAITTTKR